MTTKQCQECNHQGQNTDFFCQRCGTSFSDEKICTKCWCKCPKEANFCSNCSAEFVAPVPPAPPKEPTFVQKKLSVIDTWLGPRCSKRRIVIFAVEMLVIACAVGTFIYFNL